MRFLALLFCCLLLSGCAHTRREHGVETTQGIFIDHKGRPFIGRQDVLLSNEEPSWWYGPR